MSYEELRIDRRRAIRAEIDSAISAVSMGEYVPAHVLAFAAKGQLFGIAKARGIQTFDDEGESYIKPEFVRVWRKSVSFSYNFFKHADSNPGLDLDHFRPETTLIAIFTDVVNYGLVYGQRSLRMTVMYAWFLSRHTTWAKESLRVRVEMWKKIFNAPEGKPLDEATTMLRSLVRLGDRISPEVLNQLRSPDVADTIEM